MRNGWHARLCLFLMFFLGCVCFADSRSIPTTTFQLTGLKKPVEILRDPWGVPHIYAENEGDLFFAQGYITATDRLFQIDLWRRTGTGKLAEVLGPTAIPRDRIARLVRYRGDWNAEWASYSPHAKQIAESFTNAGGEREASIESDIRDRSCFSRLALETNESDATLAEHLLSAFRAPIRRGDPRSRCFLIRMHRMGDQWTNGHRQPPT
jgi:hypothetical protein